MIEIVRYGWVGALGFVGCSEIGAMSSPCSVEVKVLSGFDARSQSCAWGCLVRSYFWKPVVAQNFNVTVLPALSSCFCQKLIS